MMDLSVEDHGMLLWAIGTAFQHVMSPHKEELANLYKRLGGELPQIYGMPVGRPSSYIIDADCYLP